MEGLALRADVVGQIMQFSFDATSSGVVVGSAFSAEQRSLAESNMD